MNHSLFRIVGMLALSAFVGQAMAQTQQQNTTYPTGQTTTITDPVSITAGPNVLVPAGATVIYQAGGTIALEPGFHAATGSGFSAALIDNQPPTSPTNLQAPNIDSLWATISWNASTDNVGVTEYTVSRNGILVASLGPSYLSFTDSNLSAGTIYTYTVTAHDAAGNVSTAATLTITTLADLEVFAISP